MDPMRITLLCTLSGTLVAFLTYRMNEKRTLIQDASWHAVVDVTLKSVEENTKSILRKLKRSEKKMRQIENRVDANTQDIAYLFQSVLSKGRLHGLENEAH